MSERGGTTFGLYPWFEENGADLIFPDDLDTFRDFAPYGKVFERVQERDGFLTLAYGSQTFRVKPDLFKPVGVVPFRLGSTVTIRSTGVQAVVDGIQWHHKNDAPFFILRINNKTDSKRYSAGDLLAPMAHP